MSISVPSLRSALSSPVLSRILVAVVVTVLSLSSATGHARERVVIATYEGVINPVAAEYFHDAIEFASSPPAEALIVRLDTPGGLDTSMRAIIKEFTGAPIPVVVYVAPSGGRAASAGVFLTLAAHVAAMAPGTNIGAAHPVAMGGGDMDKTMKEKVENDSAAYIKSIAEQHGRNAKWAEDAVRKSVSATEKEALKLKLIDLVADDTDALLEALDGRTVSMANRSATLRTKQAIAEAFPMSWRLEVLKTLSDPNIAYVLMTLGTIGLLAELYNPGAILPGVVGAISLVLAFYSFQSLPINYAGALLILIGIVFFVLEATVTSFGILAIGGTIAMVLGSVMLMKTDAEFLQISWTVIIPVVVTAGLLSLVVVGAGVRALRRRPSTGREELIGLIGEVKTALAPDGHVSIRGELWEATSEVPLQPGERAEVIRVEGLHLYVKPVLRQREV
ncbi:serine protease [Nitrospira sp.]|nr:serine protease [Nitrospira sp.]